MFPFFSHVDLYCSGDIGADLSMTVLVNYGLKHLFTYFKLLDAEVVLFVYEFDFQIDFLLPVSWSTF